MPSLNAVLETLLANYPQGDSKKTGHLSIGLSGNASVSQRRALLRSNEPLPCLTVKTTAARVLILGSMGRDQRLGGQRRSGGAATHKSARAIAE
jgi:hypothetical protein